MQKVYLSTTLGTTGTTGTTLDAGAGWTITSECGFPARLKPKAVIYNDPATVVIWSDGTKTVVRCQDGDTYDEREGFLLCCAKRLMGNNGAFNDAMSDVPDTHSAKFCLAQAIEAADHGR